MIKRYVFAFFPEGDTVYPTPMRIAFFGYDFFTGCLEKIVEAPDMELVALFTPTITRPRYASNARVKDLAKAQGAQIFEGNFSMDKLAEMIRPLNCDLIIIAAYPGKVPCGEDMPVGVNVHPSLLPEGRGPWPLPCIILKRLQKTGITLHVIESRWDSGPIVLQEAFDVHERENLETLSARMQMCAEHVMAEFLFDIPRHLSRARAQDGESSYWQKPSDEDRTLDWNKSVKELDRIVRAFGKFNSYATFDGKEWIVDDATVWQEPHAYAPGEVVHRMGHEIVIAAKDGFVCLRIYEEDTE
jgi:methionyl-tRNA formyltransferase